MKPIELPDGTGWYFPKEAQDPGTCGEVPTVCDKCERLLAAIKAHKDAYATRTMLYDNAEVVFSWDRALWQAAGLE